MKDLLDVLIKNKTRLEINGCTWDFSFLFDILMIYLCYTIYKNVSVLQIMKLTYYK